MYYFGSCTNTAILKFDENVCPQCICTFNLVYADGRLYNYYITMHIIIIAIIYIYILSLLSKKL